jgi:hypothetical protein
MEIKQIQPSPQPASKCCFCGQSHPIKRLCRERLEAQEARRQRGRPLNEKPGDSKDTGLQEPNRTTDEDGGGAGLVEHLPR